MDLREQIGQRLVIGFPGTELDPEFVRLVREYKIGNVILLHALQVALEQDDVPYLIFLHQAHKFRIQLRPREPYHQALSYLFS